MMRPYEIDNLDDLMMWLSDGAEIKAHGSPWVEIVVALPEKAAIEAMYAGERPLASIPSRVLVEYIHFLEGQLYAAGDAVAYKVA